MTHFEARSLLCIQREDNLSIKDKIAIFSEVPMCPTPCHLTTLLIVFYARCLFACFPSLLRQLGQNAKTDHSIHHNFPTTQYQPFSLQEQGKQLKGRPVIFQPIPTELVRFVTVENWEIAGRSVATVGSGCRYGEHRSVIGPPSARPQSVTLDAVSSSTCRPGWRSKRGACVWEQQQARQEAVDSGGVHFFRRVTLLAMNYISTGRFGARPRLLLLAELSEWCALFGVTANKAHAQNKKE